MTGNLYRLRSNQPNAIKILLKRLPVLTVLCMERTVARGRIYLWPIELNPYGTICLCAAGFQGKTADCYDT